MPIVSQLNERVCEVNLTLDSSKYVRYIFDILEALSFHNIVSKVLCPTILIPQLQGSARTYFHCTYQCIRVATSPFPSIPVFITITTTYPMYSIMNLRPGSRAINWRDSAAPCGQIITFDIREQLKLSSLMELRRNYLLGAELGTNRIEQRFF